ncbi:cytochrome c oxidase subunit II [Sphingomonas sp. ac-8]|uniref:cytochrome c oxidase subunit II n=1 Tax=Sphingomonas sp. ac-8 TaxID=3242977 RepID=UPI003A7FAF1E
MIRSPYAILLALPAGGCAGPLSAIDPAGPHAQTVAQLWWGMLAGAAVLAGLVFVLLALAFRRREPRAPSDRLWIGWLGLAMPTVVLAMLLVTALVLGARLLPTPNPRALRIEVEASRYQWRFRYPGGTAATRDVLHLPAGRPVDLSITARDVIHSVWVPRLAGKMDAIPGQTNVLRIVAAKPGRYRGVCAEYCGPGHAGHDFLVVVHDDAGWARATGAAR